MVVEDKPTEFSCVVEIACAAVIITKDALWGCDDNASVYYSLFSSSNYLEMVEWLMKSAKIGIHTASYALRWAAE